ncbi:MAG: YggS family pyridoxal phosphate-dependent enzyme [Gammaproteobacteria bacterium]|nr:YggS family pyridoxal phosphate-dependent enzyme [Gammaproteobacteria bacterium]
MLATYSLAARIAAVQERIVRAEQRYGRAPGSVDLVAVSKTVAVTTIETACNTCGLRRFGENYLQEALPKISDERLQRLPIEWHFVGPLQSNKSHGVAEHFSWVHSVDRLSIAQRLSAQRPAHCPPLNICLQVNISREPGKSGIDLEHLPELAVAVAGLPHLHLRGLMTLPAPCHEFEQQRLPFRALRTAFETLRQRGLTLDTLSMGMSGDFEAAIAEGSTLVRVGSAIFGSRP